MQSDKFISYLRVSTQVQHASGLGLDAQRNAVSGYLRGRPLSREFIEVESGAKSDRPELKNALEYARKQKATLIIAKLDRLGRNVAFVAGLLESSIEFAFADMPQANKLTLHIMSAMAQHEREMISKRTKEALAAKKARGFKLGNTVNLTEAQEIGRGVIKCNVDAYALLVMPHINEIAKSGIKSYHKLADILNSRGIKTRCGSKWHGSSVRAIIIRAWLNGDSETFNK